MIILKKSIFACPQCIAMNRAQQCTHSHIKGLVCMDPITMTTNSLSKPLHPIIPDIYRTQINAIPNIISTLDYVSSSLGDSELLFHRRLGVDPTISIGDRIDILDPSTKLSIVRREDLIGKGKPPTRSSTTTRTQSTQFGSLTDDHCSTPYIIRRLKRLRDPSYSTQQDANDLCRCNPASSSMSSMSIEQQRRGHRVKDHKKFVTKEELSCLLLNHLPFAQGIPTVKLPHTQLFENSLSNNSDHPSLEPYMNLEMYTSDTIIPPSAPEMGISMMNSGHHHDMSQSQAPPLYLANQDLSSQSARTSHSLHSDINTLRGFDTDVESISMDDHPVLAAGAPTLVGSDWESNKHKTEVMSSTSTLHIHDHELYIENDQASSFLNDYLFPEPAFFY